ncbi:ABC transporter ATP-binding protein [Agromyces atrinae]|uniref:ABC transporter ATP-binding protein n=1 Tax=Agromyces atrinae TaxID=592376 RepID=A0A4Q2MBC8_9MICO|nr:ABC transporter ATP-binding protein [Agromyces atrinae]NYD68079.1 ABC-type microcin C transport system duplicated ATPase subunit YejF [Agromyces atrinae]RXZ87773.1 ABC transporter ATP-binding protein [Agromyces atrinae]
MTNLLDIRDLRLALGGRNLVDGVDITVAPGEVVGLAGESGSGKTLSALTALGFVPSGATATGEVLFDGRNVLDLSSRDLRALRGDRVAVVFQDPMTALHPMLTIERQLTEHQRVHRSLTKKQAKERAIELLDRVRIPDPHLAIRSYPHRFSGGMRQRIAIASALACEPELLIADEVTTALDVTVQAGILRLLDGLRTELGMAMLFITHDLAVMNVVSDRLYVMKTGKVVESGATRDVLADPQHEYTRSLVDALPDTEVSA